MNQPSVDRRRALQLTAAGVVGATGLSTNAAGDGELDPGEEEWSFETEFGITRSSPTVVDGTVYVGGRDGVVYAVDAETATEEWTFQTEGVIVSSPTVTAHGTVYIGSNDGHVYALDADDGSEQWAFETDIDAEFSHVWSSPTVVDGTVYVGGKDSNVYALDADDGSEQWVFDEPDDWVVAAPTVADGTVYVGSGSFYNEAEARVYALDADDGSKLWAFDGGDYIASSPTVHDGVVYVGDADSVPAADKSEEVQQLSRRPGRSQSSRATTTFDPTDGLATESSVGPRFLDDEDEPERVPIGNVYALDADDGTELWHVEADGVIRSSPTVADGTVYIGSRDGNLYALDADDGDERWRFATELGIEPSPTVAGDAVFFGSYDGSVHAVETEDGSELWEFETDEGFVRSSPTVVDGTVYIGADAGHGGEDVRLYALHAGVDASSDCSRTNSGTLGHHGTWAARAVEGPEAAFTVTPSEPESGELVRLDSEPSVGPLDGVAWEIDGSSPRSEAVIEETFEEPGEYDVALTVSIGPVSDTKTKTVAVTETTPDGDETPTDEPPAETGDSDDDGSGFDAFSAVTGAGGLGYLLYNRLSTDKDDTSKR